MGASPDQRVAELESLIKQIQQLKRELANITAKNKELLKELEKKTRAGSSRPK